MKRITYLIIFVTNIVFGQEIENKLSKSLCECFTENQGKSNSNFEYSLLEKCMSLAFEINEDEFEKILIKEVDTTNLETDNLYEYGYQLGQEMFGNIQVKLVNSCDSYYTFATGLISEMLSNIGKESNQKKIDSISKLIDKYPRNKNLIWERGAHKIGLGNLKSAKSDLNICLDIDSNFAPAMFFLACALDLDGDSKQAIEQFENILEQKQDYGSLGDFTKIYLAVLKRKDKEKN